MNARTVTFDFFDDTLEVTWDGNVWLSDAGTGAQHSSIAAAVRESCVAYVRAGGDDESDYENAILSAIDDATERQSA